jgi:hypothetical protein
VRLLVARNFSFLATRTFSLPLFELVAFSGVDPSVPAADCSAAIVADIGNLTSEFANKTAGAFMSGAGTSGELKIAIVGTSKRGSDTTAVGTGAGRAATEIAFRGSAQSATHSPASNRLPTTMKYEAKGTRHLPVEWGRDLG